MAITVRDIEQDSRKAKKGNDSVGPLQIQTPSKMIHLQQQQQQHNNLGFLLGLALFTTTLFTLTPTCKAHIRNSSCSTICGTGKSAKEVPYPFGFSPGCPIQLDCAGDIRIGEFQVQNITPSGILINLPAECNRSIETIKPLFSSHYALASRNGLLLRDCQGSLNDCVISTASLEKQMNLSSCDIAAKNDSLSCYSLVTSGFDALTYNNVSDSKCGFLFSSFALGTETPGSPVLSLQFQSVELQWWLEGDCSGDPCDKNGNCTDVKIANGKSGFRCQCSEGFAGHGFLNGCRRVSNCNPSKYLSGQCGGTTRVGVLVGGLLAGASLMAGLAVICYFVRRRSYSLRNRLSARRLLCEAAGNSSVPFYPYREIERATNGFSEKQRIGKGCVDEIIDPYLEPHRDAWTLSSVHNVAELAFRCLAFHRDMRPSMMEVAEELEHIRLSAWVPSMCMPMPSPGASPCSSENGSEKSLSATSAKQNVVASRRLLVSQKEADSPTSLEEVKDSSPVSVQDPWLSEHSSPSTNSLLGNVVQ
ncbi:hypothetical protein Tsubulata_024554 [Turnera subulata]|uniref:EGF-like domain-containing protein n=1 Tax=Turnera subulata TaxID=218843 RepID=A0A9Q0G504_9ROSI|nr:hypothetical protein Tsubulata_024554 [Turnera subulata]